MPGKETMSFILVIVLRPDEHDPAWAVFHTSAKVDDLKGKAGVFNIDETASLGEMPLCVCGRISGKRATC